MRNPISFFIFGGVVSILGIGVLAFLIMSGYLFDKDKIIHNDFSEQKIFNVLYLDSSPRHAYAKLDAGVSLNYGSGAYCVIMTDSTGEHLLMLSHPTRTETLTRDWIFGTRRYQANVYELSRLSQPCPYGKQFWQLDQK